MRIIALVGPFGAGKSTIGMNLAAYLASAGYTAGQVAIVVNEAGGSTEITTPHAAVYTLPNGCFTCQDEAVLQTSLDELAKQETQIVIMEGFGIVSGEETQAFLNKAHHPYAIIGVLDLANWKRNLVNYSELLPTHLTVADAIIATKHSATTLPTYVQEFLGQHQVHNPVFLGRAEEFPAQIWSTIETALQREHSHTAVEHGHSHPHQHAHHGHDHDHHDHDHHHHDHDHGHGWQTVVLGLVTATSLSALQTATQETISAGKMRLKGRLGGFAFNVAPGASNWQLAASEEPGDLVICYLADDTDWPTPLLSLVASPPEPARAHQLLRVDTDRSATVAALDEGIVTIRSWTPRTVPVPSGGVQVVTHPEELQLWKEMARRPGVKADRFAPVMIACLEYWAKCAEWLEVHQAEVNEAHLPTHQRELGVSLAWWTIELEEHLPASLLQRIHKTQPAALVAAGLREVSSLRADSFWRYWQGLEYVRALRFEYDQLSQSNQAVVQNEAERVIAMAQTADEHSAFAAELAKKTDGRTSG